MPADTPLLAALPVIAGFIALPAFVALVRRRATREASEVAAALAEFASTLRRGRAGSGVHPLDADLCARAQRLRVPEFASLQLAQELPQVRAEMLADTAQRLALRLKRRVAFERKMLARTASGRRRGALAASVPPVALAAFHAGGMEIPLAALLFVIAIEACGCWLLWRVARVEI